MKNILIMLVALMLGYLSASFVDRTGKDRGKQETASQCQDKGYFEHGILKFSCKQLFVVE